MISNGSTSGISVSERLTKVHAITVRVKCWLVYMRWEPVQEVTPPYFWHLLSFVCIILHPFMLSKKNRPFVLLDWLVIFLFLLYEQLFSTLTAASQNQNWEMNGSSSRQNLSRVKPRRHVGRIERPQREQLSNAALDFNTTTVNRKTVVHIPSSREPEEKIEDVEMPVIRTPQVTPIYKIIKSTKFLVKIRSIGQWTRA